MVRVTAAGAPTGVAVLVCGSTNVRHGV